MIVEQNTGPPRRPLRAKPKQTREEQLRKLLTRISGTTIAQIQKTMGWQPHTMDLSRFRAAPSARLSHLSFESDGAFPTQC